MATLEELEARVKALEDAQAAEPTSYYTSKYSGEEMDALLDYALGDAQVSANPPQMALQVLKLTLGEE